MASKSSSLFEAIVPPERQHPLFKRVSESQAHEACRFELQRAFELLPSPDGNFIKDFQSTGFDARIWELYLAAAAHSIGLSIEQPFDRPDFLLRRGEEVVWVEAVTANATAGSVPAVPDGYWNEQDQVAAKLGSPLFSKLNKRYWELPHVENRPLVLAVADFNDPGPFRHGYGPLERYLYGYHTRLTSKLGSVVDYELTPIDTLGPKKVPAGFFELADARNISAVLFSNAGTAAKFNRMGFNRNVHKTVRMLRFGFSFNSDPTAIIAEPFAYMVGDASESWHQELILFHNPNALNPLQENFFGNICQHWLSSEKFLYVVPDFFPFVSNTQTASGTEDQIPAIEEALLQFGRKWILGSLQKAPLFEQQIAELNEEWPLPENESK